MSEPRPALFPACVTLPDGTTHHPVRVATDTAGTTHAWTWDHDHGTPVEIATWPAVDLARADGKATGRPHAFTAPDGTHIEGRRNTGCNQGCGCSHPLKSWRPQLVAAGA